MTVLAIDPGYEQSAWLLFDGTRILDHAIEPNKELRLRLRARVGHFGNGLAAVVIEQIESFGMAVGREVFETVFETGRLFEIARHIYGPVVTRLPRKAVKLHLCESARATDSNIRVALVDRFGGTAKAIGAKKTPGPLYGIKSHEWAALAIAVTFLDQQPPLSKGRS